MKKWDFIVVGLLIAVAAVGFVLIRLFSAPSVTVTISQNNKIVYEGKIDEDKEICLQNNTVIIQNGEVFMESSNCKNQICVKHKKISRSGESIICLPNKVIIETK